MAVDVFDKATFEAALPMKKDGSGPAWECVGLNQGEYVYLIGVGDSKPAKILVRSSVDVTGWSRATGEDSIRVYVTDRHLKPLSGKANRWTTRLPGWQDRMMTIIRFMAEMAVKIQSCPKCDKALLSLFKVKKEGPNKGKWFLSCKPCGFFEWLKKEEEEKLVCPGCSAHTISEFTVKKDGPNRGKKFLSCSDKSCGYFSWVEAG